MRWRSTAALGDSEVTMDDCKVCECYVNDRVSYLFRDANMELSMEGLGYLI